MDTWIIGLNVGYFITHPLSFSESTFQGLFYASLIYLCWQINRVLRTVEGWKNVVFQKPYSRPLRLIMFEKDYLRMSVGVGCALWAVVGKLVAFFIARCEGCFAFAIELGLRFSLLSTSWSWWFIRTCFFPLFFGSFLRRRSCVMVRLISHSAFGVYCMAVFMNSFTLGDVSFCRTENVRCIWFS